MPNLNHLNLYDHELFYFLCISDYVFIVVYKESTIFLWEGIGILYEHHFYVGGVDV